MLKDCLCVFYPFCRGIDRAGGFSPKLSSYCSDYSWLVYAEIRSFGNTSLIMLSSLYTELHYFQFNHGRQLKQRCSLSLLFLSECIILMGYAALSVRSPCGDVGSLLWIAHQPLQITVKPIRFHCDLRWVKGSSDWACVFSDSEDPTLVAKVISECCI